MKIPSQKGFMSPLCISKEQNVSVVKNRIFGEHFLKDAFFHMDNEEVAEASKMLLKAKERMPEDEFISFCIYIWDVRNFLSTKNAPFEVRLRRFRSQYEKHFECAESEELTHISWISSQNFSISTTGKDFRTRPDGKNKPLNVSRTQKDCFECKRTSRYGKSDDFNFNYQDVNEPCNSDGEVLFDKKLSSSTYTEICNERNYLSKDASPSYDNTPKYENEINEGNFWFCDQEYNSEENHETNESLKRWKEIFDRQCSFDSNCRKIQGFKENQVKTKTSVKQTKAEEEKFKPECANSSFYCFKSDQLDPSTRIHNLYQSKGEAKLDNKKQVTFVENLQEHRPHGYNIHSDGSKLNDEIKSRDSKRKERVPSQQEWESASEFSSEKTKTGFANSEREQRNEQRNEQMYKKYDFPERDACFNEKTTVFHTKIDDRNKLSTKSTILKGIYAILRILKMVLKLLLAFVIIIGILVGRIGFHTANCGLYLFQVIVWTRLKGMAQFIHSPLRNAKGPWSRSVNSYRWENVDTVLPETSKDAVDYLLRLKNRSPYEIFGVNENSSSLEVKQKYRRLACLVHPDKCNITGANNAFLVLKHAYDYINNPNEVPLNTFGENEATNIPKDDFVLLLCSNGHCHQCVIEKKTIDQMRYCSKCRISHSARNGDVWIEGAVFPVCFLFYDRKVINVTE